MPYDYCMVQNEEKLPKSPFPAWLGLILLSPLRKIMVQRDRFLRKAGIRIGNTILELGCGPGFFTEYIAKIVTLSGTVYAQDVQSEFIETLEKRMKRFEVRENIKPLLCSSTKVPLPNSSVNVVYAANVFEEIEKEGLLEKTAKEIDRLLVSDGLVTVIEHRFGVSKARYQRIIDSLKNEGFAPVRRKITPFMHFTLLRRKSS